MKDVLFIQENGLAELLGVEALSAFLKMDDFTIDLILLSHERDYIEYIKNTDPKIIAFSVLTSDHYVYYRIASELKKKFPDKIVIMGGPHVTYYPESLQDVDVDIYCIGDGEYPLSELVRRVRNRSGYLDIPGLWIKKEKEIYKNNPTKIIEDLNNLPVPDREIYYSKYEFMKNLGTKRFVASRGCPFPCTYCFNHVRMDMYRDFMPPMRLKSTATVLKEIMDVKEKYPLKRVHFSDETFGFNYDVLKEFCDRYKKSVGIPFSILTRFDVLSEEKIRLLKDSGCVGIEIGLESGSERIRAEVLKKPVADKKIKEVARLLKKEKIKIYTSNIIGIPTETYEDMMKTLILNREIKTDYTDCNIFIPFPKLALTEKSRQIGHLTDDYDDRAIMVGKRQPRTKSFSDNTILNLKYLFFIFIKLPVPVKVAEFFIRFPHNRFYRFLSVFELYKSIRFFGISFLNGVIFFFNTYFSVKGVIFGLKNKQNI